MMRYYEILYEDLTNTEAFKKWFGNSKIVDKFGKPLRMYHGTSHNNIEKFEVGYDSRGIKNFEGNHKVISFTTDPKFANNYAGNDVNTKYNPTIYPVYIRSINPGDFRNPEHVKMVIDYQFDLLKNWIEKVSKKRPDIWTQDVIKDKTNNEINYQNKKISQGIYYYWENPTMWKQFGWDGAWCIEHASMANILNFAVTNSNQIKSAVGNNGQFDINNSEIIK